MQKDSDGREGGHPLSQQKLIFNDDIDVLPAHRAVCVEKGISGEMYKERGSGNSRKEY